jgi:hypothetical protein
MDSQGLKSSIECNAEDRSPQSMILKEIKELLANKFSNVKCCTVFRSVIPWLIPLLQQSILELTNLIC